MEEPNIDMYSSGYSRVDSMSALLEKMISKPFSKVDCNALLPQFKSLIKQGSDKPRFTLAKVEVKGRLYQGSFTEIWQGKFENRDVVLKQIDIGAISIEHVINERDISILATGKRFVKLLGSFADVDPFLVFEHQIGSLEGAGALTNRNVARFIFQIAEGLGFLHERNIIHRDIKRANILLTSSNNFIIADFGIAVKMDESQSTYHDPRNGTPFYQCPTANRDGVYSPYTDAFNFGVTIWELINGEYLMYPKGEALTDLADRDPFNYFIQCVELGKQVEEEENGIFTPKEEDGKIVRLPFAEYVKNGSGEFAKLILGLLELQPEDRMVPIKVRDSEQLKLLLAMSYCSIEEESIDDDFTDDITSLVRESVEMDRDAKFEIARIKKTDNVSANDIKLALLYHDNVSSVSLVNSPVQVPSEIADGKDTGKTASFEEIPKRKNAETQYSEKDAVEKVTGEPADLGDIPDQRQPTPKAQCSPQASGVTIATLQYVADLFTDAGLEQVLKKAHVDKEMDKRTFCVQLLQLCNTINGGMGDKGRAKLNVNSVYSTSESECTKNLPNDCLLETPKVRKKLTPKEQPSDKKKKNKKKNKPSNKNKKIAKPFDKNKEKVKPSQKNKSSVKVPFLKPKEKQFKPTDISLPLKKRKRSIQSSIPPAKKLKEAMAPKADATQSTSNVESIPVASAGRPVRQAGIIAENRVRKIQKFFKQVSDSGKIKVKRQPN